MGESTKAICALVFIIGAISAAIAWAADRPDATAWGFRIGGPALSLIALAFLLKLQFRADIVQDYLRDLADKYFNRDGFCFAFAAASANGIAYLDAYFQNQRDRRCVGRIALRPARGFFMGRAKIETITYEIECAPAAFGVARIPLPIPHKLHGKRQSFEVGASVDYPQRQGSTTSIPRWGVPSHKHKIQRCDRHGAHPCRCCGRCNGIVQTSDYHHRFAHGRYRPGPG